MTNKETTPISFEEGWKKLEDELKEAIEPLLPSANGELPLKQIVLAGAVFQPRTFGDDTVHKSETHIENLMDGILSSPEKALEPLVVWWSGKCYRVLDGHHRFEAYKRLKKGKNLERNSIPVTVFEGSLKQALMESVRLNSMDKLPMMKEDKRERAWKMVCLEAGTKPEINRATKVSTGTIGTMRQELAKLKELYPETWQTESLKWRWLDILQGKQPRDHSEDWQERQAIEWSKRLGKALGSKASAQPQIFARALEIYSERLVVGLKDYWTEYPLEF